MEGITDQAANDTPVLPLTDPVLSPAKSSVDKAHHQIVIVTENEASAMKSGVECGKTAAFEFPVASSWDRDLTELNEDQLD